MAVKKNVITCNFCGNNRDQCKKLVVNHNDAICDSCVKKISDILSKENDLTILKPTNETKNLNTIQIRNFLDQYVIGQEPAKIALCVSIVNHYKRLYFESDIEVDKSNVIISGESGSGKTLLVSTIAKYLNVPFAEVDATSLTEAGYVGEDVDSALTKLLASANGDIERAEHGIVFIDEIDKLAQKAKTNLSGRDNSAGVQTSLLKMIEGTVMSVPEPGTKKSPFSPTVEMNTKNILFIGGGAFTGLDNIVDERLKKRKTSGFIDGTRIEKDIQREYLTEDFIEYGMIPEFIGRFPIKTRTLRLTSEEMIMVLKNLKNSILEQIKFYFTVDGIGLNFTDDFIQEVVTKAKKEKTGVRGLRSIINDILLPHQYLIPEYIKREVKQLTFDKDCINTNNLPKFLFENQVQFK